MLGQLRFGNTGVLDLLFDVDLDIRQVLVLLAVALDEGSRLQFRQGSLHVSDMLADIDLRAVDEKHRDVTLGGLELGDPLKKEECLEDARLQTVAIHFPGLINHQVQLSTNRGLYPVEHLIEGSQAAHVVGHHHLGDILEDRQHGALAHGMEPAGERVVVRKLLERQLEQVELVVMERV